jgi:hypothetical protein
MSEGVNADETEWMDIESVMLWLSLTRPEVYRQVKEAKLKSAKKERNIRFAVTAVEAFDQKRKAEETALVEAIVELENLLSEKFPVQLPAADKGHEEARIRRKSARESRNTGTATRCGQGRRGLCRPGQGIGCPTAGRWNPRRCHRSLPGSRIQG